MRLKSLLSGNSHGLIPQAHEIPQGQQTIMLIDKMGYQMSWMPTASAKSSLRSSAKECLAHFATIVGFETSPIPENPEFDYLGNIFCELNDNDPNGTPIRYFKCSKNEFQEKLVMNEEFFANQKQIKDICHQLCIDKDDKIARPKIKDKNFVICSFETKKNKKID